MRESPTANSSSIRREPGAAAGYTDIHCHCLPGLDDGPPTMADAISLCRMLAQDGASTVVATPHQMGRYDGQTSVEAITAAAAALRAALADNEIPLKLELGADVRADERLPKLLRSGQVLTLAGSNYVLLELPHEVFIDPRPLLGALTAEGYRPILSHPERYPYLHRHARIIQEWLNWGASLQITAGSILGDFGPDADQMAWHLLQSGCVSLIATDAHDVHTRPPRMSAAAIAVSQRLSRVIAKRLCDDNPHRLILGEPLAGWTDRPRPGGRT